MVTDICIYLGYCTNTWMFISLYEKKALSLRLLFVYLSTDISELLS